MTKHIITFDVPYAGVTSGDAAAGLGAMRGIEGVDDVQMYQATAGQPSYMVIVDVEDDRERAVRTQIETLLSQYSSYVQNVTLRTYRPLSR